jgi:2-polyprenyl-3-methyl-5-hydroxy-6-metoxy-1,4-benzoquinol methylase
MHRIHHDSCPICESKHIEFHQKIKDFTVSEETYDLYKCSDCGFIFTQDAPDAAHIGPYYKSDDYVSHSNTNKGLFFKVYHKVREIMLARKHKEIVANSSIKAGAKILDIGAGRGYFLNHMQEHKYVCTGIEQDPDVRQAAIDQFNLNVLPPEELYKLEDKQFDVITLWHVLEHIHDYRGYLDKIKKLLKPDGLLVVALPNPSCSDQYIYKDYWSGWDVPIHLWHFTPQNAKDLMAQYQFKMIDKRKLPFDPFYLSILASKERKDSFPTITGFVNGFKAYLMSLNNIDNSTSLTYYFKHAKE